MATAKVVWKAELTSRHTVLRLPQGAQILAAQVQRDKPCLWFLCDSGREVESRTFCLVDTGSFSEQIRKENYIGTFQSDSGYIVSHVFEIKDV